MLEITTIIESERVLYASLKLMKKCSGLIEIGPYKLQSRVLLAPMAGVTDLPFRQLCQAYGAGLTTSEMVIAKTEHWDSDKSRLRFADTSNENVPHSVQIVGGDAEQMAQAAAAAAAAGAAIIDINMGCPAKKVCKKAAGSALLKDELLVASILDHVVKRVDIPVTLKIRTGWDSEHRNAMNIGRIAEQSGIQALAIHGRTRACRFVGDVEFDTIAAVKQALSIPVIANGDIASVDAAIAVANYTQADGLMIGRAAQGQPWLIAQVVAAMEESRLKQMPISSSGPMNREVEVKNTLLEPNFADKQRCMLDHLRALHHFYGEFKGLRFARKHIGAYLEKLTYENIYRQQFNRLVSVEAQIAFIEQLAEPLVDHQELEKVITA